MARKPVLRPARIGQRATSRGRRVAAGIGQHERILGVRTSPYEVWAPLRVLKTEDVGLERLRHLHDSGLDTRAFRRFAAYLTQAEAFYLSAQTMPPESRPLVAYYFFLNLTKAYLTCVEPGLTARRASHGLRDGFTQMSKYWFSQEVVIVGGTRSSSTNVFRELASRTGDGYCHAAREELSIQRLAPYLVEAADLLEDAVSVAPKLIPVSVSVMARNGEAWLRVHVDAGELRRRGVPSHQLVNRASHFGAIFHEVQSDNTRRERYESNEKWSYRTPRGRVSYSRCAPAVIRAFESSLIHSNRGSTGAPHLVILSSRFGLISQEAVAFLVMHHLSNMVRYRPEQVMKLSLGRWFFLFTTWVPRAMENFQLALMSRILKEEVVLDA